MAFMTTKRLYACYSIYCSYAFVRSHNVASVVLSVPHANAQPVRNVPGGPLPSALGASNAPAVTSSTELVALPQLLNQVVQNQVQMQQQLSNTWDCLGRGSSSGVNGLQQCSSPACGGHATPGCLTTSYPQHCVMQACSAHHAVRRTSICRHEGCNKWLLRVAWSTVAAAIALSRPVQFTLCGVILFFTP